MNRISDDVPSLAIENGKHTGEPPAAHPEGGNPTPGDARPADAETAAEAPVTAGHRAQPEAGQPDPADPGPARPQPAEDPSTDVIHLEDAVEALPAIARMTAELWLRVAAWGLGTSVRAGTRLIRAASDPEAALGLYEGLTGGLRAYAREFLGIEELDEHVRQLAPLAGATLRRNGLRPELTLRAQGTELLRQAADVDQTSDTAHPAYGHVLAELAPDEARILRVLATEGPQPMVDVRAANLIGLGSQLIAPALNMIAAQAGLRARGRVALYLNNLSRLGLIELSDESVEDAIAYQVLEAQPDVLGTLKETPRAKTVHRSIRLTPFGEDFCQVCLPLPGSPLPPGADSPAQLLGGTDTEPGASIAGASTEGSPRLGCT